VINKYALLDSYLVYYINKFLGIIPRELSDHFNLVVVREDLRDQRLALVRGEGIVDQLFPDRVFAMHGEVATSTDCHSPE